MPCHCLLYTSTLPDNVELLGYSFTSGDLCAATEEERQRQLHYDFSEGTASVAGIYVKATEDFSVTLTYTDSEKSLTKALHVTLDDSAPFPGILQDRFAQEAQPATCSADAGVAAYASLQVTQCVYTSVGSVSYTHLSVRVRPFFAYTDSSSCLISGLMRTRNTSVLAAETIFSIKQTPFLPWFSSYLHYPFILSGCQSM